MEFVGKPLTTDGEYNLINSGTKLFPKEYAKELLNIAEGDFLSAQALDQSITNKRLENILFMAQQAAEKAIKSVLVHQQIAFPLVHDLGILIALLPHDKYPPHGFNLVQLNPYASIRRYEEGSLPLGRDEITVAIQAVEAVIDWACKIVRVP